MQGWSVIKAQEWFVAGIGELFWVQAGQTRPKFPIHLLSDFRLPLVALFNRQVPTKIPYLATLRPSLVILEPLPLVYSIKLAVVLVHFAKVFR